jgi:hypothetical protein
MGLIINKTITTRQGFEVTGAYLNITEYYINKTNSSIELAYNLYINKEARIQGLDVFKANDLLEVYKADITSDEFTSSDVYTVSYDKLKTYLIDVLGDGSITDDI